MAIDPKDVVQAFADALNRQAWDRLGELITPDLTCTIQAAGSGFFRDGGRCDNRYANVYEISGDRVRTVREYMDTQHTARSFAAVTSGRGD